jgi:hypothetical protein
MLKQVQHDKISQVALANKTFLICQSEFISDSNFIVLSRAISCRIRNRVRMSLRGTRQSHHNFFLVFYHRMRYRNGYRNGIYPSHLVSTICIYV